MSAIAHRIYIAVLVGIGFMTLVFLCYWGYSYYATSIEERPFHADHVSLKPSGGVGHGLGIIGTLMILIGVFSYIGRKKKKFLPREPTQAFNCWCKSVMENFKKNFPFMQL